MGLFKGDFSMILEHKHCMQALNAIKSCISLDELERINSGDYFPECVENEEIVITDFEVEYISDLGYFEGIEPQETFIFVTDEYESRKLTLNKQYYFISHNDFKTLCNKALSN